MGLPVSLPKKLEPLPALALHAFLTATTECQVAWRVVGHAAWLGPGSRSAAGGGKAIGLSAAARLVATFSCWMTEMRLPGSGTGFSAKGLMSSSLGRLGRLMPARLSAQPARASAHSSTAPAAPSPLPSSLALSVILLAPCIRPPYLDFLSAGFIFALSSPRRCRLRRRHAGQLGLGQHCQHDARALGDAGRRAAIAQQTRKLGTRRVGLAGLLRRQPEQLPGTEPPCIAISSQTVEPILHVRPAGTVQSQHGRLQLGIVGQQGIDAALLGDRLEGCRRLGRLAGIALGGSQT